MMQKLISLDKDYSIKVQREVEVFNKIKNAYIPIENAKISDRKVYKEDKIGDNYFSISGTIIGTKTSLLANGRNVTSLVVENDYLEKTRTRMPSRRTIKNLSKQDFLSFLNDSYLYKILNKDNIENIIVSGIDDEPYIASEIFTSLDNTMEILEMLDYLETIYNAKVSIAIKNIDSENIKAYNDYLGTYKTINLILVPDLYLIGQENYLKEYLNIKENYIYLKTSDVYNLYNLVKKRKNMTQKYITITGDYIKKPRVFKVKIGTSVKELLTKYYTELDYSDAVIYVNGLLSGEILAIDNLIIDSNFNGLLIMKKQEKKSLNCLNCGKCHDVCPVGSYPYEALAEKEVFCINCGLCTYICPSYINLKKYLNEGRVDNE